ncbi:MAG: ADP-glyceromanno-heptose 6-epimerase [Kiritimatiellae bacterium]|jgi:ADP-L-glycero-D-manno-heptose 6-epimerase|nr:ADP-glyceromanno-heptose 6-epimerase [Kiritimatiellia bacterium]
MNTFSYIITGAAGFIGRNLVAELNARGETDLLLVDELGTSEKWKNLVGLHYEDIWDPETFRQAILDGASGVGVKALIHLGACSATTETDADYLLDNNYRTTRDLCEWCLEQDVRFVYASSAATYGNGDKGYSDADEGTPDLCPLNMYGYSKHMFDLWALKNDLLDQIAGIKYFNVYGPYEDHKGDMRSVVYKSYEQIQESGGVKLFRSHRPDYEHGKQLRDFVYVKDAVDVTLWLAESENPGGLYNCGTGQARSWLDLANAVFAAMGKDPDIEFIDMPATLQPKYQYYTQAEVTKLHQAGYDKVFTPLEEGVAQTVAYLRKTRG